MAIPPLRNRYDVVIAGARAAGAATAMLLARRGLSVLAVDPARRGSDTLSTHALMRGGVLQLHRWGVLDQIRAAGTPRVRATTFHYGSEAVEVAIEPRDGVDALYAPRRTVLDEVLVRAAEDAGAQVVHGVLINGLRRDASGRVTGAYLSGRDRSIRLVEADLVVGADGRRSRVARDVGAEVEHLGRHSTATIYGHVPDFRADGYHWHYQPGLGVGVIPTNHGEACVFAGFSPEVFHRERERGLSTLFHTALASASSDLAEQVAARSYGVKLRAFAGAPGFRRCAAGPGWALVGDAGYFRDPITAHGLTDALRDAELLARAASTGADRAFAEYQATRDALSRGVFDVTDRLASFEWSLEEAKELHLRLSSEMNAEVAHLMSLDSSDAGARTPLLRSA